jgi:hypothetical protein
MDLDQTAQPTAEQPSIPSPPPFYDRRFISREEFCPYLWEILERAVAADGLSLVDLKTHLLSCENCQEGMFNALSGLGKSMESEGPMEIVVKVLLKKLRSVFDSIKADALARLLRQNEQDLQGLAAAGRKDGVDPWVDPKE